MPEYRISPVPLSYMISPGSCPQRTFQTKKFPFMRQFSGDSTAIIFPRLARSAACIFCSSAPLKEDTKLHVSGGDNALPTISGSRNRHIIHTRAWRRHSLTHSAPAESAINAMLLKPRSHWREMLMNQRCERRVSVPFV